MRGVQAPTVRLFERKPLVHCSLSFLFPFPFLFVSGFSRPISDGRAELRGRASGCLSSFFSRPGEAGPAKSSAPMWNEDTFRGIFFFSFSPPSSERHWVCDFAEEPRFVETRLFPSSPLRRRLSRASSLGLDDDAPTTSAGPSPLLPLTPTIPAGGMAAASAHASPFGLAIVYGRSRRFFFFLPMRSLAVSSAV